MNKAYDRCLGYAGEHPHLLELLKGDSLSSHYETIGVIDCELICIRLENGERYREEEFYNEFMNAVSHVFLTWTIHGVNHRKIQHAPSNEDIVLGFFYVPTTAVADVKTYVDGLQP